MFRFRCTVISPNLRRVTLEPASTTRGSSAPVFCPGAMSTAAYAAFRAATGASSPQAQLCSSSSSSNCSTTIPTRLCPPRRNHNSSSRAGGASTAASFSRVFQTKNLPGAFKRPFLVTVPAQGSVASSFMAQQQRFSSTNSSEEKKKEEGDSKKSGDEKTEDAEKNEKDGGEKKGDEKEKPPKKSFLSNFTEWKEDLTRHPDVYNVPNMMNLLLFSLFCLASTGSNTEADWWVNQWGIDGSFKPWTWALHSWMTNNLPPMAFGMMLIHSMAHTIVPTLGNAGLLRYCVLVSVLSGFSMWAFNAAVGQYGGERQFGPWDVCAGLFVMSYLHHGITPFVVLSGFQSWLRYASFVGAICTLYYNPQPTVSGTIVGLVLCKTAFKAPAIKAAV